MNSQAFTPEEVKQGLLNDLMNYLLDYNKKNKEGYYDIHIWSDGYCTIVDWNDINYEFKDEVDEFKLVKGDEQIMTTIRYPDKTFEYCYPEEKDQLLKDWLEEHKDEGWEMSPNSNSWSSKEERDAWNKVVEDTEPEEKKETKGRKK